MRIKFLGAAKTVTGSFFLIDCGKTRMAIDCGLFQGNKAIKERNYGDFKIEPQSIDFLILTHAHIDHSGLIPKLFRSGFRGPIYCNDATAQLCEVLLPDSAHVQAAEVERKNRKLKRAGQPLLTPIYTIEDALQCLQLFRPVNYDELIQAAPGVEFRLRDAGHILGSAVVELWLEENGKHSKVVFSGDLGQGNKPIIRDPSLIEQADFLVMESTYGNRSHLRFEDRSQQLKKVIDYTMVKGGNLIIPAFAVERTQDILFDLNTLYHQGQLDQSIDIYIDSPLAIAATEIFIKNTEYYDGESQECLKKGKHPLKLPNLKYSHTQQDSVKLNQIPGKAIIISASGMCDAGRIKHHLKHNLWRPESTILLVGYQAAGSLGRRILEGDKQVTIHGESISVKADIKTIDAYSAHADQVGLLNWVKNFSNIPERVFLVHGEEEAQETLAGAINGELGIEVIIPDYLDECDLIINEKPFPIQGTEDLKQSLVYSAYGDRQAQILYKEVQTSLSNLFKSELQKGNYQDLTTKLQRIKNLL